MTRKTLSDAFGGQVTTLEEQRAIWLEAFQRFPDWDGIRDELRGAAVPYMRELNALTGTMARPWDTHPCYGAAGARVEPADSTFRHVYAGFGG